VARAPSPAAVEFGGAAVNRCTTQNQMKLEFFRKLSEPRCFHSLAFSQPKRSRGSQFHAVPTFVLGAIESLIRCLDHLLGLAIARARFGDANADRHRETIRYGIGRLDRTRSDAFRFCGLSAIRLTRAPIATGFSALLSALRSEPRT
jgi:hypothetical protein